LASRQKLCSSAVEWEHGKSFPSEAAGAQGLSLCGDTSAVPRAGLPIDFRPFLPPRFTRLDIVCLDFSRILPRLTWMSHHSLQLKVAPWRSE